MATSVPADAHHIKFISGDFFYIMQSPESTSTNNKLTSLVDFIKLKSDWERTLIENFNENTNVGSLLHFITNKSELLIASDGSKTKTKSGGGWAIVAKDETILIRGFNPDYGQIETMYSYRSEVYASLVSQLFLKTYAEDFQVLIESKITSYYDNKAYYI